MCDNYHEKETIRLFSTNDLKPRPELHNYLLNRAFISEDEFYFLDRKDVPELWQSISIITVNIFLNGSPIYETEHEILDTSVWNELQVDYLLATLPAAFIETCVKECELLADKFNLQIALGNKSLKPGQLKPKLQKIADDLAIQWDEPGSEVMGILIESSYV